MHMASSVQRNQLKRREKRATKISNFMHFCILQFTEHVWSFEKKVVEPSMLLIKQLKLESVFYVNGGMKQVTICRR